MLVKETIPLGVKIFPLLGKASSLASSQQSFCCRFHWNGSTKSVHHQTIYASWCTLDATG